MNKAKGAVTTVPFFSLSSYKVSKLESRDARRFNVKSIKYEVESKKYEDEKPPTFYLLPSTYFEFEK